MEYVFDRDNVEALLEKLENTDVVKILGEDLINLLGVNNGPKGRKPIEVDETLFNETFNLWIEGKITARDAMARLDLKPNTFYRRIKERRLTEMKDIKSEIKETLIEEKKDFDALKNQVRQNAKEAKAKADEALDNTIALRQMQKDIFQEKIAAEIGQKLDEREMRSLVDKERREQKEQAK